METQTDGIEWVLGVLFGIGILTVIAAATLEWIKFRRGDPGGDGPSPSELGRGKAPSDERD